MKKTKEQGITLIALAITLVVLLILAVVTIKILTNNGVLTQTTAATSAEAETKAREQLSIILQEASMAYWDERSVDPTLDRRSYLTKEKINEFANRFRNNRQCRFKNI